MQIDHSIDEMSITKHTTSLYQVLNIAISSDANPMSNFRIN